MVLRLTLNQTISNLQKTVYCNGVELNAELFFIQVARLKQLHCKSNISTIQNWS